MSYTIVVTFKGKRTMEIADTLDDACHEAHEVVLEGMSGFSEDREVLKSYGYLDAEDWALNVPEDGGRFSLADGTEIEVINNKDREES